MLTLFGQCSRLGARRPTARSAASPRGWWSAGARCPGVPLGSSIAQCWLLGGQVASRRCESLIRSNRVVQAVSQGQVLGRCSLIRRAEVATLAGTLMSVRRRVAVSCDLRRHRWRDPLTTADDLTDAPTGLDEPLRDQVHGLLPEAPLDPRRRCAETTRRQKFSCARGRTTPSSRARPSTRSSGRERSGTSAAVWPPASPSLCWGLSPAGCKR